MISKGIRPVEVEPNPDLQGGACPYLRGTPVLHEFNSSLPVPMRLKDIERETERAKDRARERERERDRARERERASERESEKERARRRAGKQESARERESERESESEKMRERELVPDWAYPPISGRITC